MFLPNRRIYNPPDETQITGRNTNHGEEDVQCRGAAGEDARAAVHERVPVRRQPGPSVASGVPAKRAPRLPGLQELRPQARPEVLSGRLHAEQA